VPAVIFLICLTRAGWKWAAYCPVAKFPFRKWNKITWRVVPEYLSRKLLLHRSDKHKNFFVICVNCKLEQEYSNIYATRWNVTQFILSGNCSTCFGWYYHPSSGAKTSVSIAFGICHTAPTSARTFFVVCAHCKLLRAGIL